MIKRSVIYFRNDQGISIQGIGNPSYVAVGQECPRADIHGGGRIGSIDYEDGMLTIRKVDSAGKPCRAFGLTTLKNLKVVFDCAGVMVPADRFAGILFNDEPVAAVAAPVQTTQNQGNQQNRGR